jgi:carbonic anhydrase
MPNTPGVREVIAGVQVNLTGLLPRDASYSMQIGPPTASHCSESTIRIVLKTPEDISAEEINGFAEFNAHVVGCTQLLNGPTVKENQ